MRKGNIVIMSCKFEILLRIFICLAYKCSKSGLSGVRLLSMEMYKGPWQEQKKETLIW